MNRVRISSINNKGSDMDYGNFIDWYNALAKPDWTPSPQFIGLVWQNLYLIILVTFTFVFVQVFRGKLPRIVALPFIINLIANFAFTPIQFGLRNLPLASLDILIVWGSIIWLSYKIWPHYKSIAILQIPYFIWVTIATFLQLSITYMNW